MKKLNKIFLLVSLIGILLLLFISQHLEPKTINISEINKGSLDDRVKILGDILDSRDYSNNTFHVLTIEDLTGVIEVVFNTKEEQLKINSSKSYFITGKVQEYNQTLQINAEKIVLKS